MAERTLPIINDILPIEAGSYINLIQQYVSHVSALPFVQSVYQAGSLDDPGISDIDMVVVVDSCVNPEGMNRLSVQPSGASELQKYCFVHDIYLYNHEPFVAVNYTNYFKKLKLLHGVPQPIIDVDPTERRILSLQIIFDFIASRLAQFNSLLHLRRLPLRGVVLRVSSIKHSAKLLANLGIRDRETEDFISKVHFLRKNPKQCNEETISEIFYKSFYFFSRIVTLAASYFAEHYLNFHSNIDDSSTLKLNGQYTIKFIDHSLKHYMNPVPEYVIYYPKEVFYHYLAYTRFRNVLGLNAARCLSYTGSEAYDLDDKYHGVLKKRLDAISNHLVFLKKNRAFFAMRGNPGFQLSMDAVNDLEGYCEASPERRVTFTQNGSKTIKGSIFESAYNVVPFKELQNQSHFPVSRLSFEKSDYENWVLRYFPDWKMRYGHMYHKKLVELYVTFSILEPAEVDTFMDAAGGRNTYINKIPCRQRILQGIENFDHLQTVLGGGIQWLAGNAAHIPLPDNSVSKISCHHSFEHFQETADTSFIREVRRLLKAGGKCCIIPIFIADTYLEVTRSQNPLCPFDQKARYIVDPTARITGGNSCGDYARIYDIPSFLKRVLLPLDQSLFKTSLFEITIGGLAVPDMGLSCHAGISKANFPYRALTIEKIDKSP